MFKLDSSLLFRRIKLYGFGLALGLVFSYVFFNDRYPTWLPGSRIMEELNRGSITYGEKGLCLMSCNNISKEAIGDLLKNGDVNFSESETRGKPCPTYAIEGESPEGRSLRILFIKCDSVAEVVTAFALEDLNTCNCE